MAQIPIKMCGSSNSGKKQPPNYRLIYHLGNEFANPTEEELKYAIATGGWTDISGSGYTLQTSLEDNASLVYYKTLNNVIRLDTSNPQFYGIFLNRTFGLSQAPSNYNVLNIQVDGGLTQVMQDDSYRIFPTYILEEGGSYSSTWSRSGFIYRQLFDGIHYTGYCPAIIGIGSRLNGNLNTYGKIYPYATNIRLELGFMSSSTWTPTRVYFSLRSCGFYNRDKISYLTQKGYGNTESDIVANINTASSITGKKLFEDEDAVKYLINYCTGSLMITGLANSTFVTAMQNSPYYTLIQADEDWARFIALL